MKLAVVDLCDAEQLDPPLSRVLAAIADQLKRDFWPVWGLTTEIVRVEPSSAEARENLATFDGIVYLAREATLGDKTPLGYHVAGTAGIPAGFVFPALTATTGQPWSVALSHEILEMLVDPDLNLLVAAPHPTLPTKSFVLRSYEICDPVQASTYTINGVEVADFVTPQYFTSKRRRPDDPARTHVVVGELAPLGVLPGGYFNYFDVDTRTWHEHPDSSRPGAHENARKWSAARAQMGDAPRGFRRLSRALDSGGANGGDDWPTR